MSKAAAVPIHHRTGLLKSKTVNRYVAAFVLAAPALAVLGLFWFWPVLKAVQYSFYDYNLVAGTLKWIGLGNYSRALHDASLHHSLAVTFYYFLIRVPLQVALSLGLALLVQRAFFGVGYLRTLVLLPTITSMVVVTTIWGIMYHPTDGLLNGILQAFGFAPQKFLIGQQQALPSIAVMTVWKNVGLTTLFYLAGLTGIPHMYYEAAMIDGAGAWQRFRHITLPLLRRTTVLVLIDVTIHVFQVFTPVFLTTEGGPLNSTRVVVLYVYEQAFKFNRMGYASAISVILAVILGAISVIQFLLNRERRSRA